MRVSPLTRVEHAVLPRGEGFGQHVRSALGRMVARYNLRDPNAITPTTGAYGLAIAGLAGPRMDFTYVYSQVLTESSPRYSPTHFEERRRDNDYVLEDSSRPQPRASIHFFGRHAYQTMGQRHPRSEDMFDATFEVFDLEDDRRLVQVIPGRGADISGEGERSNAEGARRELFAGTDTPLEGVDRLVRINLGYIEGDGRFTPTRDFNEKAFGADLIPALNLVSSRGMPEELNFQVIGGYLKQLN